MARTLGRYELLRPLARGGMAEVFLARQKGAAGVEKQLVIKRIRPERAADPRFMQLFVHEARLSVALAHENIVPVFDFGRVGDELFLAMEFVDGRDLGAALARARDRALPAGHLLAAHLGAEACQGLGYAHGRRVVHRDITPRNVLCSFAGEVKLVDFGIALAEASAGGDGKVRGTPAYMSPEQARGEPLDARSDLFSLGLVLFEVLAGARAYPGADAKGLLAAARVAELPLLPGDVPAELRAVVERATRPEPAERYADARAMQRALEAFVVKARAARPEDPAPGQRLADWLHELFDGDPELGLGSDPGEVGVPDGPVVTFAADGDAGIERAFGDATMRSVAETALEAPAPSATPAPEPATLPPARRPGRAVAAFALLAGVAAAAFFVARATRAPSAPAPAPPPAPVIAAAPSVDAAPPPPPPVALVSPDAAPPPPAPHVRPAPALTARREVHITVSPWAFVTIDGKKKQFETPFKTELTVGPHRLRIHNPHLQRTLERTIQVTADGPAEFTFALTQ